jgi:hypothetical protein
MLPNFFIVGAAKSGTTAVFRYLRQHPDVYLPDRKEPRFFSYDAADRTRYGGPRAERLIATIVKDQTAYEALYSRTNGERAIGDASPSYLPSPIAAGRIRETVPDARIVAVLRNPVERAYSHFLGNVRNGFEPETDFERVLALREQRQRERWWRKWDYVGNGFYGEQLQRYFERFDRERIKVYRYEELRDRPNTLMQDLLGFLGVDPSVELDVSGHHNVSAVPKNERVQWLMSRRSPLRRVVRPLLPGPLRRRLKADVERRNSHRPDMPSGARAQLVEIYGDDIARLEILLGQDLSSWRVG